MEKASAKIYNSSPEFLIFLNHLDKTLKRGFQFIRDFNFENKSEPIKTKKKDIGCFIVSPRNTPEMKIAAAKIKSNNFRVVKMIFCGFILFLNLKVRGIKSLLKLTEI